MEASIEFCASVWCWNPGLRYAVMNDLRSATISRPHRAPTHASLYRAAVASALSRLVQLSAFSAMAEAAHSAEAPAGPMALLFVITCFVIGIATKFFLSRVKIPYTAMLLIWGLCIGLLQAIPPATVAFTETLKIWMHIDPHLLLLIFLPTIGFSAGINQEPHLLRKNWGQILLLAWPGVVINFLLIGLCARFFFPYQWTWPQCLLFGAMLSATDPVAVVAVLHEVGADEKLGSVIDGESLVNDGSALVVFLVLQRFVQGDSMTAGQIVVLFCQLALLGAAVGLAFGAATSLWLSRIWRDPGLDIVLTFTAAYGCYFVAEELLGASGLLAVVVMGFSMSLIGGRQITQRFKLHMHAFWEALEWMANTILFIWVGLVLAVVLLPTVSGIFTTQQGTHVRHMLEGVDLAWAVVLYLWLLVARAAAIGFFYPLLSSGHVGYAINWRQALVMVWAGLRGGVGVAMSLFIFLDPLILDEGYKVHCIFFMVLMAFSTVLINGSTTKYVLQGLGLLDKSPEQLQVLDHVIQEVEAVKQQQLAHPSGCQSLWSSPVPALVDRLTKLDADHIMATAHKRLAKHSIPTAAAAAAPAGGGATDLESGGSDKQVVGPDQQQQLLQEYRQRLLRMNKAHYGMLYNTLYLSTTLASWLQEASDAALDAVAAGGPLRDWQLLRLKGLPRWVVLLLKVKMLGRFGVPAAEGQVVGQLRMVSAFVMAHQTAQQMVRQHLQELTQTAAGSSTSASAAAATTVLQESQQEVEAALQYGRQHLLPAYPRLPELVASWEAALAVVHAQETFLQQVVDAGLVAGEEVHHLQHMLSQRLLRLMHTTAAQLEVALTADGAGSSSSLAAAGSTAAAGEPGGPGAQAAAANGVGGSLRHDLGRSSLPIHLHPLNYTTSLRTSSLVLPNPVYAQPGEHVWGLAAVGQPKGN